jgi:hypothetical protein
MARETGGALALAVSFPGRKTNSASRSARDSVRRKEGEPDCAGILVPSTWGESRSFQLLWPESDKCNIGSAEETNTDRLESPPGGAKLLYEDFGRGVGTYLKVIRFMEPPNPDGLVVVYPRPSGQFLFVGYWRGYERSFAGGTWERNGSEVHLKGRGSISIDVVPGPEGGDFDCVFTVGDVNHTPSLTASCELKEWSLLSWTGSFMYVGQYTIIDPDGQWMPNSPPKVDSWIAEILGRSER